MFAFRVLPFFFFLFVRLLVKKRPFGSFKRCSGLTCGEKEKIYQYERDSISLYSSVLRRKLNSLKSLCSTVFKDFHLHLSSKERAAPEESQGSPGGVLSNIIKQVHLLIELQK